MSRFSAIGHEDRLTLVEHLDELRTRLIWCIVAFMIAFSFCYWQNDWLLRTVNEPLQSTQNLENDNARKSQDPLEQAAQYQARSGAAQAATTKALRSVDRLLGSLGGERLTAAQEVRLRQAQTALRDAARANALAFNAVPANKGRQPITLGVTEPFVTTFTLAGYAALLISLPFLLYQAYAFVLPAFSDEERKIALPLMLGVPVLFICGVAFGYFVALPRAIGFLQNFNDDSFDILIRAADYYKFSVVLMAIIGLLFQIPVGVLAVTRAGLVSARQLAHNRGYIILGLAVVAAVATPTPDPVTMIIAMAPLLILFELSVLLARIFERRRERSGSRWDTDDDPAVS
jgi:sec-independent protein translocase protein TatC